ncbi:MAG TPA: phenylacetate-CoA oxygenase subunit PaaI [Bacillus bacterium]|uniref:Phenylacetic acid degradation protein n=1 Tax=Siminovitchia fordii TaxID=254759 RepID=A0ABQ4K5Y1_9BACI|nr:1,2-phenylacetyl-CoA epoxidase subunit PaaC [Siminovitchia fordii]GIN21134.1 phenylacetic acid degradation protein [Siminovitchia fordii]HBZ09515.1 phenylacetate-CoA oxygenase subunit PaaI [Bacillus sp. (in: firmicutes)]
MTDIKTDTKYKEAVADLLFQFADDDFLIAFRGSEWLGLAPHIEEDVAFSSISQDCMGHSAMFYSLLEDLGYGTSDELAHLRSSEERRNSILSERPNGEGYYMDTPKYDWAYAVVRNYFYTTAKKAKIDSLKNSSYKPAAEIAAKVSMELFYHTLHWKTWFVQLLSSSVEAIERMKNAIDEVAKDFGDMFIFGKLTKDIHEYGLIEEGVTLQKRWFAELEKAYTSLDLELPEIPEKPQMNGRIGEHSKDLDSALKTLSEVYRLDTAASW